MTAERIKALEEALRPFADLAAARGFDRLPDHLPMTHGSSKVTAGDFKAALAASQPVPTRQQDLTGAFREAIEGVGLDGLKATSMFGSQPAQPVAMNVKPLEWEEFGRECVRAESPFGRYDVIGGWHNGKFYLQMPGRPDQWLDTLEAAKAAAQADYEARIMVALDAQPLTVQDAARVPEIAALIEKSEALRDDVTGRVDAFGERIGTAQPMIGFGAKQWADFITALRTIAEGR